jgi:hypothetical protein
MDLSVMAQGSFFWYIALYLFRIGCSTTAPDCLQLPLSVPLEAQLRSYVGPSQEDAKGLLGHSMLWIWASLREIPKKPD